jgi:hypothetical protein
LGFATLLGEPCHLGSCGTLCWTLWGLGDWRSFGGRDLLSTAFFFGFRLGLLLSRVQALLSLDIASLFFGQWMSAR